MRTEEIAIYQFEELPEGAKDTARQWFREVADYPYHNDNIKSIKAFCGHFGVTLKDWSIYGRGEHLTTDAENHHFRGYTLEHAKELSKRGYFPESGLWLDGTMIESFYEDFKRTGNALYAFQQALESALSAITEDIDYQFSDEAIDEMLIVNGYEFDEDGRRWA
jgi:hypothetical protein